LWFFFISIKVNNLRLLIPFWNIIFWLGVHFINVHFEHYIFFIHFVYFLTLLYYLYHFGNKCQIIN
jgi:hypothetical protein